MLRIIDANHVDRVFEAPPVKLEIPTHVFVSVDADVGRLETKNTVVSFYKLGDAFVISGAREMVDLADVAIHIGQLFSRPALHGCKFVVITRNTVGHSAARLRELLRGQSFANQTYFFTLSHCHRDGIPFDSNCRMQAVFGIATLFAENRIRFDQEITGDVKRELKTQFESMRKKKDEDRVKYTGDGDDSLFWNTAIGLWGACNFTTSEAQWDAWKL